MILYLYTHCAMIFFHHCFYIVQPCPLSGYSLSPNTVLNFHKNKISLSVSRHMNIPFSVMLCLFTGLNGIVQNI